MWENNECSRPTIVESLAINKTETLTEGSQKQKSLDKHHSVNYNHNVKTFQISGWCKDLPPACTIFMCSSQRYWASPQWRHLPLAYLSHFGMVHICPMGKECLVNKADTNLSLTLSHGSASPFLPNVVGFQPPFDLYFADICFFVSAGGFFLEING